MDPAKKYSKLPAGVKILGAGFMGGTKSTSTGYKFLDRYARRYK